MKNKIISGFLTLLALTTFYGAGFSISTAEASRPLPPPPEFYVMDEAGVLSKPVLESLQTLLVEHDQLTDEQVVIAIFRSLDGEDPVIWTNQIFSKWGIGKRGKDNGILLALYWKEHKARIEVGYGLEPIMTDAKSKRILSEYLVPELRNGNPDRAITLSAIQILKTIDSPLIQNGRAQEILEAGGFRGSWSPKKSSAHIWNVWIILGFILLVIVLNIVTATDAHFTRRGWYRPRPRFPNRGPWDGWSGGSNGRSRGWDGASGRGSPGGFTGGGGLSGGGGASGDW